MDHPDDDTPSEVPYGCRHCATRAAFVGGTARMPRDCPTLTHGDVAKEYGVFIEEKGFANRATFLIDIDGVIRASFITAPGQARSLDEYTAALRDLKAARV